jgi:HEAT repeat protein
VANRLHALAGRRECRRAWLVSAALAGALACLTPTIPPVASAQDAAQEKAQEAERQRILADFVHYMRIQRHDLAKAMGERILDLKMSERQFVEFVDRADDPARVHDAWTRAITVPEVRDVAARMMKAYNDGRLARARDPQEIARNIDMLAGTLRARMIARERLVAAGEYAMPQLLKVYLTRDDPRRQEVQGVMVALGRQAVMPLCAALPSLPPAHQEQVADVLGLLAWRTSVPFLVELADATRSDNVKQACARAIERLGGAGATAAELFRALGETYYAEKSETISFPGEDHQLLWSYDAAAGGLIMTAIRTAVYHEAMAMSLAERSMSLESQSGVNPDTLALWVAANYSREIDSPPGYENPAYPTGRRGAEYYGIAAGAEVAKRVLARALDTRDTLLARRALAAVERTAGSRSLETAPGTRNPLVEALTYPNRRVQFEAALAIAAAQPTSPFAGSDRVVPVLASMVHGTTNQYAVVLAGDPESYQGVRRVLQRLGFTVMPHGRTMSDLTASIAESPSVDLVVAVGFNVERFPALVEEIRGMARTGATPVVGLVAPEVYLQLRHRYGPGSGIEVRQIGLTDDALANTVSALVAATTGGSISAEEAAGYTRSSLASLRDLALSHNQILNVGDATVSLITALEATSGETRLAVAEILSRIADERAQRAVMDAALRSTGEERIALFAKVSQSARLHGNRLEERHVRQVASLAGSEAQEEATAAASLLGALEVPNTDVLRLIRQGR